MAIGTTLRRTMTATVGLSTAAMMVVACTSATDSAGSGTDEATGLINVADDPGEPKSGGTLAYAQYSMITDVDPAGREEGGSQGGSELAAVYDLLMRYDPETDEYVPQLAEDLTTDDDVHWTLSLREGVTFSDGTPVDADAVLWSIERYLDKGGSHGQAWRATVESIEATDDHTIEIVLQRPWDEFPAMLNLGPGMIVAPSSEDGDEFTPIGAGPFVIERIAPGEEVSMTAREDYFGGRPHLDRLVFPHIVSERGRLDSVRSGDIEAAYLRNADTVDDALEAGEPGYAFMASMSGVLAINQRDGFAGADERVRRAIVAAVDPELFNDRVSDGLDLPGSEMFPDWSIWHSGADGPAFDPDAARELLDEAKADGYDGKLVYLGLNDAQTQRSAQAFQTMLGAVGFDVETDLTATMSDLVRKMYVESDYDIGFSGFNVFDQAPFIRLFANLDSASTSNALGLDDPEMDALLLDLQEAGDADAKRAVLADIQELVDQTAPFSAVTSRRLLTVWNPQTHKITPTLDGILLFDKAWVE